MKTLELSPDFTLEDIRKVRDYNYEMTKDMTSAERSAYYKGLSDEAMDCYNDFLAKTNATLIVAEPAEEYHVKKKEAVC